jgi:hypothetical protein
MSTRKNNGPTTAEAFRAVPPAIRAPSEGVARTVWALIEPRLIDVGGQRLRRIEDVAGSVLKRVAPAERAAVELVAMQALTVAVDTVVCAGHHGQALFINDMFTALAARWSHLFRGTPGRSIWSGEKKADTLIDARREMLKAGVDFDRLWTAVCDGIAELYKIRLIGGAGHSQGRRVELARGEILDAYERAVAPWRRPTLRHNRILLADVRMPSLKIAAWTVAERDYDVMNIGDRTKEVIEVLQSTRLFLDATEVSKDVDRLQGQVRSHEWPKRQADWRATWVGQDRSSAEVAKRYQRDRLAFRRHFKELRAEYNKLLGRLRQVEAIARQIDAHSEKLDERGHLEIKTAYYKTRSRRFQPRHFWPTEVSSKEDAEPAVLSDAEVFWSDTENDEIELPDTEVAERLLNDVRELRGPNVERIDNWLIIKNRPDQFTATTSPRGRWFRVRAQFEEDRWWETDEHAADGTPIAWNDDYTGPRRPLIGFDASSSMYHLTAVALGWKDAERLLEKHDFKTLMAGAVDELAKAGMIDQPAATPKQRRNAMGALAPYSYGAGLAGILRKLRGDPAKYGIGWGDSKNLQTLLDEGRKINEAIAVVVHMRQEYLGAARALATAAEARSAYDGLTVYDPFDGVAARWHRPITQEKILRNGAVSLMTRVPVGEPNADGFYPANYNGREVSQRRRGKDGKWHDVIGKGGKPKTRRIDTKGSVSNLVVPGLIHALDASYAGHIVLALRARGVRDVVIVNDCFLVPSDARPLLTFALEDAARPWLEGLGPFYRTFEEYLADDRTWAPVVRRWRVSWEGRVDGCRRGTAPWPTFRFKDETTVTLVAST